MEATRPTPSRDARGWLQSDPVRFPSGLEALAAYVHDKGLKFGLYLSPGSETCAMYWDDYPASGIGSYGHERQDAEMLQRIGVDYLKYDWCRADKTDGLVHVDAFTLMRDELARLDRPIVYSISEYSDTEPWTWAPDISTMADRPSIDGSISATVAPHGLKILRLSPI